MFSWRICSHQSRLSWHTSWIILHLRTLDKKTNLNQLGPEMLLLSHSTPLPSVIPWIYSPRTIPSWHLMPLHLESASEKFPGPKKLAEEETAREPPEVHQAKILDTLVSTWMIYISNAILKKILCVSMSVQKATFHEILKGRSPRKRLPSYTIMSAVGNAPTFWKAPKANHLNSGLVSYDNHVWLQL